MFKILIVVALAALSTGARASTSYSRLLAHVQSTYLKNAAKYPILIMDRDDLEWRFTKAGAVSTSKADQAARAKIVQDYVLEKTGVRIDDNAAANFEPYLTVLEDAATAMPAIDDSGAITMCAVFPDDPNRNQRLETERILQLNMKDIFAPDTYARLRQKMNYADYVLFSVLHESGHCMDRYFFPELYQEGADPSTLHQAESYADTIATLLMAKEGRTNVAEARAYLRDVYSYFLEPYYAAHPENGIGDPNYPYAGLIYHLSPSIRAAGQEVSEHLAEIQNMSLTQIQDLAAAIVRAHAYGTPLFTAIFTSYAEGRDAALQRYTQYAKDSPDIFAPVLQGLQDYMHEEDVFKASAFLADAPSPPSNRALKSFDLAAACAALKARNFDAIRSEIEDLRQDLEVGGASADDENARFQLLANLWSTLPAACAKAPQVVSF